MKTIKPTFIFLNQLKAYLQLTFILTFVTLSLMLTPYFGQAQISQGGTPFSFSGKIAESYPIEVMPSVDIQAALKQDAIDDEAGGQPYRFGINIPVNINVLKQGETQILAGGNKLIRQGIRAAGAITINLTFSKFRLPKGAKLFIYNKDKTHAIGAFTDFNNQDDHKFGTILIKGDEIALEYFEPANTEFKTELTIGIVTHGYKDAFGYAKAFGSSGSCETNVNCPAAAGWECEKRSVVMLVVGSNGFCTGALVNNTNQNKTPYVLTANHCLSGVPNVSSWVFYFNWESATCTNPTSSPTFQSMSGAALKANNAGSDFALVQINTAVPDSYNPTFAGWSRAGSTVSSSYGIHHPSGDIKKFSASENPTLNGGSVNLGDGAADCWRTGLWTLGVTEPGSSGSPLFDPDHLIIGQLYGGPSSCTAPANSKYDYYGKFHVSWSAGSSAATRLKEWLDPAGTNPTSLGLLGCAPPPTCDAPTLPSVSNITISGAAVNWSAVMDAVTYKVEYKKSSAASWTTAIAATASTSFNLTGLSAGTPYNVRVTTNCASLSSVASPTANFMTVCNLTASTTPTPVLCNGSSNGSINLTTTGGTPAFSYNWGIGQPTTEDRTGLVAGTYSVTVTDANGCTASSSATVTQPNPLIFLTPSITNVTCTGGNDGKVIISTGGGTLPVSVAISPNVGTQSPSLTFNGLIAQTYVFTATDINGCTKSTSVVVGTINTASVAPTSISGVSITCLGDSTTLTLVGGSAGTGATAKWYSGSCGGTPQGTGNSITVAPPSTTTYFVRYEGNCNTTTCASLTVIVYPIPIAPVAFIENSGTPNDGVICQGTSVVLRAAGGSTNYLWNTNETTQDITVTPNITATYSVRLTNALGCSNIIPVTVTVVPSVTPSVSIGVSSNPICSSTSVTFTPTPTNGGTPPQYQWYKNGGILSGETGNTLISNSLANNDKIKVQMISTATCASPLSVESNEITMIVKTPSVTPTSLSGTSTICNGGSTTLTLVGGSAGTGATAKWYAASCGGTLAGTGNSITVSPTTNTTYFVRYEGDCNTTACASQLITVNTLSVAPTSISGATNICLGSSTTLTVVGGSAGTSAVAEWFTGSCGGKPAGTGNSITVSPTDNTIYYVRYNGICNTTACASVTVTITTPSVGGTVSPAQSQGCGPQTVNLSVSGINGTVTRWERQTNCTGAWASIGNAGLTAITVITPNSSTCYRAAVANGLCPSANSSIATITVDKTAVGGRVTLQNNQTATSTSLCPSENALLIPKNYVGKVANWQYSFGTSPIWYDLSGTEGQTTLTVNGSFIVGTVFYRVVIVTELGICTGLSSVAYSSAFRITQKTGCLSPEGSLVNNNIQTDQYLNIQKVYPNPANAMINLDIEANTEGVAQLEIMDVVGRQVLNQTANLTEGMNSISLDISQLSRGIFIVKMTDAKNQKAWVKMVKE